MKGRENDVLTLEQAQALTDALPIPTNCEVCRKVLAENDRYKHSYGPFFLHACGMCKARLVRHDNMKKGQGR